MPNFDNTCIIIAEIIKLQASEICCVPNCNIYQLNYNSASEKFFSVDSNPQNVYVCIQKNAASVINRTTIEIVDKIV